MRRAHGSAVSLLVIALLAASCRPAPKPPPIFSRPEGFGPISATSTTVATTVPSAPAGNPPGTTGTFAITLRDQNAQGAEQIPLLITGPMSQTLSSDASGRVRFRGPEGQYTFQVPAGCTDRLIVLQGGGGNGYLVAGQEGRGEIEIKWQHRIAPGKYTASSVIGDWPVGRDIDLRYNVDDRCENDRGISKDFSTFRVEPSPTIEVVGTPSFASDSGGFAYMRVRCKASGAAAVVLFDSKNPPDRMDLLDYIFEGRPACS